MEKIYFDNIATKHIIQLVQSDKSLSIYEYGRFNEMYERVNMRFKLYSDANTLQDLLNYMDKNYTSYDEGDKLFITENDKFFILNTKKQIIDILDNRYLLKSCCYKNIYTTENHEFYILQDINLNELLVIKTSEFDAQNPLHLCDEMFWMHKEKSMDTLKNFNRVKHFQDQLQLIGCIVIDLHSPEEIEFNIKFHEAPDFTEIKEKSCIYNLMNTIRNSHYDREYMKMIL